MYIFFPWHFLLSLIFCSFFCSIYLCLYHWYKFFTVNFIHCDLLFNFAGSFLFSIVFNQDLVQHLFVSFVLLYFVFLFVYFSSNILFVIWFLATASIVHLALILYIFCFFWKDINPLTLKISLVILLPVCHIVLLMLIWRIWYWIN